MTLITPGMWIARNSDGYEFIGQNIRGRVFTRIENRPYLCTEVGVLPHSYECLCCGIVDIYLKIQEMPRHLMCPVHWRPLLSPKADFLPSLLAPADNHEFT